MDLASVVGLILCFTFMIIGIVTGKLGVAALPNFFDPVSIFVTFGGSFFACMAMTTMKGYVTGLKSFSKAIKLVSYDESLMIKSIIELSNIARKEGLLALEEAANNLEDQFLKKGVLLVVDGTDPELVRGIMDTELSCIEERHFANIGFWDNLGAMGPAWGMIGTLIGLVNMLKDLSDLATIGPNMAVALITTFYGSVLVNWICTPVSNKLKLNNAAEVKAKSIVIEGLLSIQAGENPRVIEEKLKSFLSPEQRNAMSSGGDEGGEK